MLTSVIPGFLQQDGKYKHENWLKACGPGTLEYTVYAAETREKLIQKVEEENWLHIIVL